MAATRKTKQKQAAIKKLREEAKKQGISVDDFLQEMEAEGQDGQKKPRAVPAKKGNGKNSKSSDSEKNAWTSQEKGQL